MRNWLGKRGWWYGGGGLVACQAGWGAGKRGASGARWRAVLFQGYAQGGTLRAGLGVGGGYGVGGGASGGETYTGERDRAGRQSYLVVRGRVLGLPDGRKTRRLPVWGTGGSPLNSELPGQGVGSCRSGWAGRVRAQVDGAAGSWVLVAPGSFC